MSGPRLIVGVGMSSRATRDEVADLLRETIRHHGYDAAPVAIATRATFADDPRLQLGYVVVGFDDATLIHHSDPVDRSVGIPARVAETAAALAAGPMGRLAGPSRRSANATAAIAIVSETHVACEVTS